MKLFKISTLLLLTLFLNRDINAMNLNILCWNGYAQDAHVDEFKVLIKNKYKIELHVKVTNASNPADFFEMIKEKKVDLISPAHNIAKSKQWPLIVEKLVLPINIGNIPNYSDLIAPLQKPHYISVFDDIYGVPIVYGVYGLYYNADIVIEAPTSWNVFWDKKYKDKYSISADYAEANAYITSLALNSSAENINHFDVAQFVQIREKYIDLVENANNYWQGVDEVHNLKGMAIATGWGFSIQALRSMGENWKLASPKEGTTGWIDNWMIGYSLANKPLKKRIAEEWINFSISPKIQAHYVTSIGQSPVNHKAATYLSKKQIKEYRLDNPNFIKTDIILWPTLVEKDQKAINAIQYKRKK